MDDGSVSDPTATAPTVTNGPSGREREAGPSGRERDSGSRTGPKGPTGPAGRRRSARSRLRDADFETMSGVPLEPVYGPDDGELPGRVPLHPRALRLDVPLEALDDADVRRLRHRRGHQPAVQGDPRAPAATASRPPSTCRRCMGRDSDDPHGRGRGRQVRRGRRHAAPTWRTSSPASTSATITTSMTINSPAAVIFAMYVAAAETAGRRRGPGSAARSRTTS